VFEITRDGRLPSRREFLATLGAVALASPLSCARDAPTTRLRLAIESVPLTLDPRGPFNADTAHVQQLVYNTLVTKGPNFTLAPELATKWDISSDFTTHTLALRSGVRFHDGRELTSRDVAYTFESLARGQFGKSPNFHALDRVETPDTYTARFVSKVPNPGLLVDFVAVGIIPGDTNADTTSLGTGPFRVATFDRDGAMRLDAFDSSVTGRPAADGLDLLAIPDATTREAALVADEIDLAINTAFTPEAIARLGAPGAETRIVTSPGGAVHYVALNVEASALAEVRVRRALTLALNRSEIANTLLGGRAHVSTGPLPPGHWAAAPVEPAPFDPSLARQLVHEANGGAPIAFEILTLTNASDIALATVFQESWEQVGIDVRIVSAEPAVFFDRLTYGDFAAALHRFTGGNQFTTIFKGAFHSRSIHVRGKDGGEINYARFADSEVDTLIDRADVSPNDAERVRLYEDIQWRIAQAAAWVPLWHPDNVAIVGPRVGAIELNPGGDFYCLRGGPLASH
jgi:peptide/nickel transport system substrate-binding protein